MRARLLQISAFVTAVILLTVSWFLRKSDDTWVSDLLINLGATALLVIPVDWLTRRLTERVESAEIAAKSAGARATAVEADVSILEESIEASQTSQIDALREALEADQIARHRTEVKVYEDWGERGDRGSLMAVLRIGREVGLISTRGLRSPVWETNLHMGFHLANDDDLAITLETDSGHVKSRHRWPAEKTEVELFRELDQAVRDIGEHLGPLLFAPTESIQSASSALVAAAKYRAQRLRLGSDNLKDIIETVEGWYITDEGLCPQGHEHYLISVDRMWEMDWEEHITRKGWDGIYSAIRVARALHKSQKPPRSSPAEA